MRTIQTLLLAGILAALTIIGVELHQLARFVAASPGVAATLTADDAPAETREQRTERIRRQARELQDDLNAILTDPHRP